jgi:hypothetical protein
MKEEFLLLVRRNPELCDAYVEDDLKVPGLSGIKRARRLASTLRSDILKHVL